MQNIEVLRRSLLTVAVLLLLAVSVDVALGLWRPPPKMLGDAFRSVDQPGLIYAPVPGERSTISGWESDEAWTANIDSRGARRAPSGDPSCARIWVLGDSYPFGWGVSDAEPYPALLPELLSDELRCRPEVSNWGVPGYHLGQSLQRLKGLLGKPHPELVILHIDEFDGFPDFDFTSPLGLPRWLARYSTLIRLAQSVVVRAFDADIVDSAVASSEQRLRLLQRIEHFGSFAAERGLRVLAVAEPELDSKLLDRLDEAGFGVLSTTPCGEAHHRFPTHRHYTELGHLCVAELLEPRIRESLR